MTFLVTNVTCVTSEFCDLKLITGMNAYTYGIFGALKNAKVACFGIGSVLQLNF